MSDDPDSWVLDEDFVRGGRHEPPARTRDAVARFGGERSSWRQPGSPAGERSHGRRRRTAKRRDRRWWQLSYGMQWLVGLVLLAGLAVAVVLLAR